jgi:hypothetical protein
MAKKLTVSYYGDDFTKIRRFLIVIARSLPIEWEFTYVGNTLDIINDKLVFTDILIYDVSDISDSDCSRLFEFLLNAKGRSKSRIFAKISGNKFAENYCATNHDVPYEIPYDDKSDYMFWLPMILRLFNV